MRPTDTLRDLRDAGEVVDSGGRTVCAHCGADLGPVAAVGLVVQRAVEHLAGA